MLFHQVGSLLGISPVGASCITYRPRRRWLYNAIYFVFMLMRSAELERNDEQNLSGIERNEILTNSHLLIGLGGIVEDEA